MKTEFEMEWEWKLSAMSDEQIVDAIKNRLPKKKVPMIRQLFIKEHIKRYKRASETK